LEGDRIGLGSYRERHGSKPITASADHSTIV
jgi:hypothetical protein